MKTVITILLIVLLFACDNGQKSAYSESLSKADSTCILLDKNKKNQWNTALRIKIKELIAEYDSLADKQNIAGMINIKQSLEDIEFKVKGRQWFLDEISKTTTCRDILSMDDALIVETYSSDFHAVRRVFIVAKTKPKHHLKCYIWETTAEGWILDNLYDVSWQELKKYKSFLKALPKHYNYNCKENSGFEEFIISDFQEGENVQCYYYVFPEVCDSVVNHFFDCLNTW